MQLVVIGALWTSVAHTGPSDAAPFDVWNRLAVRSLCQFGTVGLFAPPATWGVRRPSRIGQRLRAPAGSEVRVAAQRVILDAEVHTVRGIARPRQRGRVLDAENATLPSAGWLDSKEAGDGPNQARGSRNECNGTVC